MFEWVANPPDRVQFSSDLQLPEFVTPPNISTETHVVKYLTGSYSYLIATFYLNRKSGFYLIQTYIPSILIVILSWVSFWIDVKAVPARISLGLLTVLSMTTQSSGALGQLPRVSYIKAIDVWMSTCLVFVFGALIEYAIANVLARQQSALEHWEELRAILDSQRTASRNGAALDGAVADFREQQSSAGDADGSESVPLTFVNRRAAGASKSSQQHQQFPSGAIEQEEDSTCSYSYIRQRLAQAEARGRRDTPSPRPQRKRQPPQQPQQPQQPQPVGARREPGREHLWTPAGPQRRADRDGSKEVGGRDGNLAEEEEEEDDDDDEEEVISSAEMIDRISRVAFPISFAMFNLGYWVYYVFIAE